MTNNAKSQSSAEHMRSKFRHDVRTSFNVLIGYSEIFLEELGPEQEKTANVLREFIHQVQIALRETEYALERSNLASQDLFILELSGWLKKELLPIVQKLVAFRSSIRDDSKNDEHSRNLDVALRRLARQCIFPFDDNHIVSRRTMGDSFYEEEVNSSKSDDLGRVLIVDDQWDNLAVLKHKLERLNCSVTAITSPSKALHLLKEISFDVVLVDLEMPEMSGLDFLSRMTDSQHNKNTPVLVVTATDDKDRLSECINRGAVDFLPKPVDPSILKARVLTCLERKRSADRENKIATELVLEKARVDELLNVILPAETIIELKETGSVQPRRFNNVVVLFCDVVNFTAYCNKNSPEEIVSHLHSLFSEFDTIIEMSGLQKIKTIGDSYMAAGNLLRPIDDPLSSAVEAGLNMIDASAAHPSEWQVRVGIHIGEVVAGIIGTRQYQFDLWGDTVNMAARVEAHGQPMCVSLTASLAKNANPALIRIKSSKVQLKGKGRFELVSLSRTTDNSPR